MVQQTISQRRKSFFQLAGHEGGFRVGTRPDTILKRATGNEEECFKELTNDSLLLFTPKMFRVLNYDGDRYLEMQDLLSNFDNVSVMDVKMGCRTYREDELNSALKEKKLRHDMFDKMVEVDDLEPTEEEKRVRAVTKPRYMVWRETVSSTASLGFRIEGLRLADGTVNKNFKTTKFEEDIIEQLIRFVPKPEIQSKYIDRLHEIKRALDRSRFFSTHELIGTSLLFVHSDEDASIWLIDFAKTHPIPETTKITHQIQWHLGNHEDGYLIGLDNLIRVFQLVNQRTIVKSVNMPPQPTEGRKSHTNSPNDSTVTRTNIISVSQVSKSHPRPSDRTRQRRVFTVK